MESCEAQMKLFMQKCLASCKNLYKWKVFLIIGTLLYSDIRRILIKTGISTTSLHLRVGMGEYIHK